MTNIFTTDYKIIFGSEDEARSYILGMSKDERIKYLSSCIDCLIFKIPQFNDYDSSAVATKIINNYSDDEYFDFTQELKNFLWFTSSKNATDQFVEALTKIIVSKERKSLKSAYLEKYPDYKSEINDMISTSIAQTYKMVSNHIFLLLHQLFNKLCDETNFVSDERFVKIADLIRKSSGKLQDATKGNIVRIIRNGIAHMSALDNAAASDCKDIDSLNKNMKMKITSKDGSEFVVIEGQHIIALMAVMCEYLADVMKTYNVPKEYYYVADKHKRQILLDKYKEILNNEKTKEYEEEFISFAMDVDLNAALSVNGYTRIATALDYPQVMYLESLMRLRQKLTELNSSRNKAVTDVEGVHSIMGTLGLTYLFGAVSNLVDLKLTKSFVSDSFESEDFKNIRLFKMDTNPKKKSVINKFRLLRNCLAHAYILQAKDSDRQLFDIDEVGEKIDLGKIDEREALNLCDYIESYIMQYYYDKLESLRINKPTKNPVVM